MKSSDPPGASLPRTLPDPDAVAALEQTILASPADAVLVADYLDLLTVSDGPAAALEKLAEFQDRAGTPLAAVLFRLEERLKNEGVRERFADLFAAAADDPYFSACSSLWQAHIHRRPLDREACRIVQTDKGRAAAVYFCFIAPPLVQVSGVKPTTSQAKVIEAAGVKLPELQAGIDVFARFGSREWEAVVTNARHASEAVAADVAFKERFSSQKDRMVAERTLRFIDPLTGQWLEPYDSFLSSGKAIYAFAGQETFHLIYAYLGVEPIGIYLPGHDLILSLTPQLRGAMMGEQIANIRAAIVKRMARMPDEYEAAASAPPDTRLREIVFVVGRTENFAHHLWNFYAAIERLVLSGAYRNVDVLLTGGTQFFGPIPELFPELSGARYEHDPGIHQDPRPFRTDALVVPTGSNYVPASLSRRVVETMRRRPKVADALDPVDVPHSGPVVWFGMRLGDKSWVDQETGIPHIIGKIVERHPDALFVIDGFSFPVGADKISDKWADVIAELNRIAEAARAASPNPERVLNLVGNTLRENVLWADATDVYLAPLGSTQHKVGWFTDAPGLVYAPPMYGGGKAERTVSNWAIEIGGPITWLIGTPAGPGKRRGSNETRIRMQNIELDADDLAERMLAMLDARLAERGGWRASKVDAGQTRRDTEPARPDSADGPFESSENGRGWLSKIRSFVSNA